MTKGTAELNEQTKREIAEARTEAKAGKTCTLAKVKKELQKKHL